MSDGGNRRDIELRIRAQDLSSADFKAAAAAVKELSGAVTAQVEAAKNGSIKVGELRESMVKLQAAAKGLQNLAGLIDRFKDLSGVVAANQAIVEKNNTALAAYRAQLEQTGNVGKAEETKLAAMVRQLELSEAALQRNQAKQREHGEALVRSGVYTTNLVQAQKDLAETAGQVGPALTRLNEATLSYNRNLRTTKEAAIALAAEQRTAATQAQAQTTAIDKQRAAYQQRAAAAMAAGQQQAAADKTAILAEQAKYAAMLKSAQDFNAQTRLLIKQRQDAETAAANAAVANARQPITTTATTVAVGVAGARGAAAASTLFGLRPYELQNLSYQINDIVSGLAMGQRASQILAQQGGQVLQIFNKNLFDLLKFLPQIALGAAAATVAIAGLASAFRDISSIREFTAVIRSNADGANYSAPVLNKLQHEIRQMGVAWDDTATIMRQAIGTGLNQDRIKDFAQTARDIADIRPDKSVTEAFKDLTQGFSHGIEGIRKLNDEYHYFSASELQQITDLYNNKKAVDGLNLAIDILQGKTRNAAKDALSDMGRATRDLGIAWSNLTKTLGDTGLFQNFINGLNIIVSLLDRAVGGLNDFFGALNKLPKDQAVAGSGFSTQDQIESNPIGKAARSALGLNTTSTASGGNQFVNRGLQIDTDELKKAIEVLTEATKKAGLPEGYKVEAISAERPGAKIAGTNTLSEHSMGHAIDVRIVDASGQPIAGSMGTSGAKIDSTGLYAKLDAAFEETIKTKFPDSQYAIGTRFSRKSDPGHYSIGGQEADSQATREGRASPFTARQDEVANAQKAVDLAKLERQIKFDANEEQAKAAFERKARQDAEVQFPNDIDAQDKIVKLRMEERETERFNQAKDHQLQIRNLYISDGKNADAILAAGNAARQQYLDSAKNGLATLAEANKAELLGQEEVRKKLAQEEHLREQTKAIDNQLSQLNRANELKDTSSLENRLKGVTDQYSNIRRNVQKLAEETTNSTTGAGAKDYLEKTLPKIDTAERAAKQLEEAKFRLEQLNSLQQQRTDLVQATNAAVAAGAMTASEGEDAIKAAFDRTTPAINAAAAEFQKFLTTADALDATKIDLYTAKLKEFRATATYISPLMKSIKEAVENSFTTGMTTAFETVSEAIGGVIAKTKSWKDVLLSLGQASAKFFADLLKDIAAAILKYEGLKLASSLGIGGDSKGGGDLSVGGIFGKIGSLFGGGSSTPAGWVAGTGAGSGIYTNLATGVTSDVAGSGFAAAGSGGGLLSWLFHEGGVVGQGGRPRVVPASYFINAPRYHTGSVVGLGPDEQTAILKRGEEVLTADSPRNVMNRAGKGGASDVSIRNVLVMDESLIPSAMSGTHGERTTMAHIVKNAATIRQIVKG